MARHPAFRNRLLSQLAPDDVALLADHILRVDCPRGMTLAEPNTPIPFAYFPESGIASVIAISPEGLRANADLIGRCGFVHPALVLGSDQVPYPITMQIPGEAYRIASSDLIKASQASTTLRQMLTLFAHANTVQITYSTLSNTVHSCEERLARWLLMCLDRSEGSDLALTHEVLSVMLSVRRPTVTTTLHVLEGNGLVECTRGFVAIRNRRALEEFAGDAYGRAEAEYQRLLGPL